jgi:hypothetical protein
LTDPDLTGVDPERRAETLRRMEVLDRYVALASPGEEDDAAHASQIGVGVAPFLRLARIWREHRRPALIPGAARRERRPLRPRMAAASEEVIDQDIRDVDPRSSNARIDRPAADRLRAAGLPPVDDGQVWERLMRARERPESFRQGTGAIAIDQVGLDLSVEAPDVRRLPLLHVVLAASALSDPFEWNPPDARSAPTGTRPWLGRRGDRRPTALPPGAAS